MDYNGLDLAAGSAFHLTDQRPCFSNTVDDMTQCKQPVNLGPEDGTGHGSNRVGAAIVTDLR